jgi:hypothetical protein
MSAVAILTTIVAGAVGRHYAPNFSVPGTESQRALDLLGREIGGSARTDALPASTWA